MCQQLPGGDGKRMEPLSKETHKNQEMGFAGSFQINSSPQHWDYFQILPLPGEDAGPRAAPEARVCGEVEEEGLNPS